MMLVAVNNAVDGFVAETRHGIFVPEDEEIYEVGVDAWSVFVCAGWMG